MVTTFYLWYPKSTIWTLFKLTSIHEFHKFLILFRQIHYLPVLFTIHPFVELTPAFYTVDFLAWHTLVFCQVVFNLEDSWTARGWTPASCAAIFVNKNMERKFEIFFFYLCLNVFLNIGYIDFWKASFFRTKNGETFGENFVFKVFV